MFFFFNDTATTEIYTLSLHDALPISAKPVGEHGMALDHRHRVRQHLPDRKSTRLNSSHMSISYAVFCLKKKRRILSFRTSLGFIPKKRFHFSTRFCSLCQRTHNRFTF